MLFQNGCVVLLSFVRLPAVSINRQAGSVLNVVLNSAIIPRQQSFPPLFLSSVILISVFHLFLILVRKKKFTVTM